MSADPHWIMGAIENLEDSMVKAFSSSDPSHPSLVLSRLGAGGQHYAAIVRYTQPYGDGKVTVCSAKGDSLGDALFTLNGKWRAHALYPGDTTTPAQEEGLEAQLEASIAAIRGLGPGADSVRTAIWQADVRATKREQLLKALQERAK